MYGLDLPQLEIVVSMGNLGRFRVLVGDRTPDEMNFYVKLGDYGPVYLVDYTWVEVLERLVTDPPRQISAPPASAGPAHYI